LFFKTLIKPDQLAGHLDESLWVVVDCRFSLADSDKGQQDYIQAHIPGAVYAHLDRDLCSPVIPGKSGRHPLPAIDTLVQRLSNWGIDRQVQVVTYDSAGGAMAASRLWWLLRWLGHEKVAVLDGGWQAWLRAGLPVFSGEDRQTRRNFIPELRMDLLAGTSEVGEISKQRIPWLLDSRNADRFRGENETIDPVPGHIPGAISAPYVDNLNDKGEFLPVEVLRERFHNLLDGIPVQMAIFYCGSGVTAAHNLLALTYAGLGDGKLYVGSWSEWITDPSNPVETS
jgi:thiosulfate/3-mercaptopyruvate sulfurtransferase